MYKNFKDEYHVNLKCNHLKFDPIYNAQVLNRPTILLQVQISSTIAMFLFSKFIVCISCTLNLSFNLSIAIVYVQKGFKGDKTCKIM
jgi:hypothetical protein